MKKDNPTELGMWVSEETRDKIIDAQWMYGADDGRGNYVVLPWYNDYLKDKIARALKSTKHD